MSGGTPLEIDVGRDSTSRLRGSLRRPQGLFRPLRAVYKSLYFHVSSSPFSPIRGRGAQCRHAQHVVRQGNPQRHHPHLGQTPHHQLHQTTATRQRIHTFRRRCAILVNRPWPPPCPSGAATRPPPHCRQGAERERSTLGSLGFGTGAYTVQPTSGALTASMSSCLANPPSTSYSLGAWPYRS